MLYEELASRVVASTRPRVQAGDCVATLGVAAGLQRRGVEFHLIWLDVHGDFNFVHTHVAAWNLLMAGAVIAAVPMLVI